MGGILVLPLPVIFRELLVRIKAVVLDPEKIKQPCLGLAH